MGPDHTLTPLPLVSVVIPTYNRADLVQRAIDSALAQTYPSIQVVVVDDGSSDTTPELLHRRYATDHRVLVIQRDNGGVAAARNTGLAHATGVYIAFLDSDDVWLPWKLEAQVGHMERHPDIGMTWSDFSAIDETGRIVEERHLRQMYRNIRHRPLGDLFSERGPLGQSAPDTRPDLMRIPVYSGDVYAAMLQGSFIHTSTVVLRRSLAEQVGPFDESLTPNGEDFDFHLRTTRVSHVGLIDVPTALYRVGAVDQLSGAKQILQLATNAERTVEKALSESTDDPRVSRGTAQRARAEVHTWFGRELLEQGARSQARRHLRIAWRQNPNQSRFRDLIKSHLPLGFLRRTSEAVPTADSVTPV